ncbi:glutathione S-transferase family protein [Piscinibacter sp.]|uniref:glutathione S-transferase family protein n=1 Tax=Piscinibacter sp. TaxID=1903157 RepID=UPI0039E43215
MQLHYYPSNASMTPHMLLEELGVPYERVLVDRAAGAHRSPAYLALNPNGKIPVLVDGELVLYETAAIVLHLLDTHPQAALAPAPGGAERAMFYKWLMWLSNTLQAEMPLYFYSERWADGAEGAAQVKRHAEAHIAAMVDQLEAELARHGGPWFLGERFGALDPYVFMLCRWTRGMARPARTLPRLGAYLRRMLARPAVQRVIANEALAEPYV